MGAAELKSGGSLSAMEGSSEKEDERKQPEAAHVIPFSPVTIDISLPLHQMRPHIIYLCQDLFKKWSPLDESVFLIETVSGGVTNLLLKVSVREESGKIDTVTVRLFGPNTDLVIDRKREFQALPHISAAGFGAELLGWFENGMVQSFIDARTLSPSDMKNPEIAKKIAGQLRSFHQVAIPGSREPQLWNDIFKFLNQAETLKFDDNEKQATYESISFNEIRAAIDEVKNMTDRFKSPVVFSHNDLLSGNLMFNDKQGILYFIDFEYGSYNYRGYDIANHFNEFAGLECDFNLYPDKDTQYHFFRNYLDPGKPYEVPVKDLEALFVETNTFRLASHIYWALWGLIQAKASPIDFDYLVYFFKRFNEYKKQKETCFSLAGKYLYSSSST
ncbi:putative ethanolamine kinase [Curcuma longa]|uniref:putative ethanolamine kinase n=1 Tax=Curcuma longa TaxID=136217 RepID=UPI003D9DB2E6